MLRSLDAIILFGLLGSAAGTGTSMDATVVEATRRCGKSDFNGMVEALANFGKPLGYEHGKGLLRSCFTNSAGECTLGSTQCAWIKKCLMAEGPCEQIPIEETFAELPGGTQAYIEMMSQFNITENTTHVNVPVSMLMETFNKVAANASNQTDQLQSEIGAESLAEMEAEAEAAPKAGSAHRRRQPSRKLARIKAEKDWRAAVKEARGPHREFHNLLWRLNNTRWRFLTAFPEDSQRKWAYNVLALLGYLFAGCATTFSSIQTTGYGNHQSPVYTHYAPLGVGSPGEYIGPIYNTFINTRPQDWTCTTGTRTYKKHIWENMYGRVGWPNPSSYNKGYIPRQPGSSR